MYGYFTDVNNLDTEIDWIAYMQQIETFINGTLDYDKLIGQTGPCVYVYLSLFFSYPAGYVYIYSLLYRLTSNGIYLKIAQYIFIGIYIFTLLLVFNIYRLSKQVPPYVLVFMCLTSYRIHSIYLLRLFNDPIVMLFIYGSINAFLYNKFTLGSILYSIGLSIKMNALLFAPGILIIFLWHKGVMETIGYLCECLIVQLLLGLPFLIHNPMAYLTNSFNFGRQFLFEWTVNWRLVSESLFLDKTFHCTLLAFHLVILFVFILKFVRSRGGMLSFISFYNPKINSSTNSSEIIYILFISNFIGMVFSRSLHYQFYVWYFHTLPYLLWSVNRFSSSFRLLTLGLIELCWNVYPSTSWSSGLLHVCQFGLLIGLLTQPMTPHVYKPKICSKSQSNNKTVSRHHYKAKQS